MSAHRSAMVHRRKKAPREVASAAASTAADQQYQQQPAQRAGAARAYRALLVRAGASAHPLVLVPAADDAAALYRGGFYGKGTLSRAAAASSVPLEQVQLSHVETFFLASNDGLACLHVFDVDGNRVDEAALWNAFVTASRRFAAKYAAYRALRRAGFVPKSGVKLGVDLVAYKRGPCFYHARYAVLLQHQQPQPQHPPAVRPHATSALSTWSAVHALVRMCGNVAKHLLVFYVAPDERRRCARVRVLRRWAPAKGRIAATTTTTPTPPISL